MFKSFFDKLYAGIFIPKNRRPSVTTTPKPKVRSMMKFYYNDPNYPNLIGIIENPEPKGLPIECMFLASGAHQFTSKEGMAANAYALCCQGIDIFNSYFGLKKWAAVNKLTIDPMAGQQANAYYDRRFLKFFYFSRNNKTVYTSLSADIVMHELGHALLDAIRPDFFSAASIEVWSFHEAFGDIHSMICALHFDPVVNKLLEDTGGNLRQSNIVSSVAEEFGIALNLGCGLRDANNTFKYVNPETLPTQGSHSALLKEPHSFARVMTGIFYDIFVEIYERNGKTKEAIIKARDYLKETFYKACINVPCCANFYEAFCENWMVEDGKMPVSYRDILVKVFTLRDIFRINKLVDMSSEDGIEKEKVFSTVDGVVKLEKYKYVVNLQDLFKESVFPMDASNFADMKVELAVDEMSIKGGFFTWQRITTPFDDAVKAAKDLVEFIFSKKLFSSDENSMWYKSDNNTLTRRYFQCDCYKNNSTIPGSPEYGKGYKPLNNSGCCTYGSCANLPKDEDKKVEKTCNIRYSSVCGNASYKGSCSRPTNKPC